MSKITDLLKEVSKDVLTKESLAQIETVFTEAVDTKADERATIATEAALAAQDDEHSSKLEQLLESIDKDHTKKLNKVVEAVDADRARKLKNVVRRFQTALTEEASGLKDTVVESVSDYLDSYIAESVPTASIEEATKNKRAFNLLKDMRKMLSVDMVLANDSIREAIQDGKKTIEERGSVIEKLNTSNTELATELQQTKKSLFIEKRLGQFDEKKSNFIRKTFVDRDLSFIEENFDYTVNMFDKKAQESLDVLKEEAIHETKTQDAQVEIVKESSDTPTSATSMYAQELANMRL
jgi:hypothetical protein